MRRRQEHPVGRVNWGKIWDGDMDIKLEEVSPGAQDEGPRHLLGLQRASGSLTRQIPHRYSRRAHLQPHRPDPRLRACVGLLGRLSRPLVGIGLALEMIPDGPLTQFQKGDQETVRQQGAASRAAATRIIALRPILGRLPAAILWRAFRS